jgi:hypothetical protein
MNVTPDNEAPIMPYATTYQGDWRFPVKKESLFALRDVMCEIKISKPKYAMTIAAIK